VLSDAKPDLEKVPRDRVRRQQVINNLAMNGVEAMQSVADRPRDLVWDRTGTTPTMCTQP